jgi:hypothetical protein
MGSLRFVLPKRCIVIHRLGYQCQVLQVGELALVARWTEFHPNASNRPQPRTFHQRPLVWDRLRAVRFTPTPVSLSLGSTLSARILHSSSCKFILSWPFHKGQGDRTYGFPVTGDLLIVFPRTPEGAWLAPTECSHLREKDFPTCLPFTLYCQSPSGPAVRQ